MAHQRPDADTLLQAFIEGLHTAQGDRLVDVLGVVSYKLKQLADDPASALRYARGLLPVFQALIDQEETDLGLRGAVAEALCSLSLTLEAAARLAGGDKVSLPLQSLQREVLAGFAACFEKPTSLRGRLAIAETVGRLEPTREVIDLARVMLRHSSSAVRKALPPHLRVLAGAHPPEL